jgi:hypothetical protein
VHPTGVLARRPTHRMTVGLRVRIAGDTSANDLV